MATAMTEATGGIEIRSRGQGQPHPFHWTVDAYRRAWDAGVFAHEARLELVQGRIIEKMPPSPLHVSLSNIITDMLRAAMPALTIRVEGAVHIEFDGEPILDVTAVRGVNRDYLARHPVPAEVALLVEVAISSAEYDLGAKARLYAQAGITDYWMVLPNESLIAIHREPTSDGYASVTTLGVEQSVVPLAAPETRFAVADLLGLPEVGAAAQ